MSTSSTYAVIGMTCAHCVASVTEAVTELPGVAGVDVDLTSGRLTITSDEPIDDERVRSAVADAGYQLTDGES